MAKFDADNNSVLMAIIDAEDRHPKPGDGPTHRFPTWDTPLVKVGDVFGRAIGYTRTYGLISWKDDTGDHMEWFPAGLIKRVERSDWHGR